MLGQPHHQQRQDLARRLLDGRYPPGEEVVGEAGARSMNAEVGPPTHLPAGYAVNGNGIRSVGHSQPAAAPRECAMGQQSARGTPAQLRQARANRGPIA
jgi:hypothetical protein